MKKIVLAIAVVLTLGFTVTSCKSEQKEAKEVEKEVVEKVEEVVEKEVVEKEENKEIALAAYHCSMDCEEGKTYNKPGQCPVCKMDLKLKESKGETDAQDQEGETEEQEG